MEPVRLSAATVVLRPHTSADIDGVLDQSLDPESHRWTTIPEPYTREHAEHFVRELIPRGWATGSYLAFAVADPATEEYLGTVDLHQADGSGTGIARELGFGLRPSARGKGVMAAAVRTLAAWALGPRASGGLGLATLFWKAQIGNWASRRVAWAAGFRVEGMVRDLCSARGSRYDGWIGSLCAGDPLEPRTPWFQAVRLEDPREPDALRLRPFDDGDADRVVEACTDPTTRRWLGTLPDPYTKESALAYIRTREEAHAAGLGIYWAAEDPGTGRCVGSFGLMDITPGGSGEVGYWVHPDARGRGVATRAVRLIVRHAGLPEEDGGLGLRRLTLRAATANTASQRVAEKAGFEPIGVERAYGPLGDGSIADHRLYDRLLA